jgi:hypothetical protein
VWWRGARGQSLRHEIEAMSAQTDAAHFGALTRQEQVDLRRLLIKLQAAADVEDEQGAE